MLKQVMKETGLSEDRIVEIIDEYLRAGYEISPELLRELNIEPEEVK